MIDLSHLNDFVQLTSFKMETVASVLLSVREGDFLASLDLKDAYFQIPIHGSSRKLLRFMSEGTVYQFKALCFGLSTAPQVFTRVFAAVSAWAHSRGIRLLHYLDDWLVLSSSEKKAKESIRELLSLCHTLGIVINEKKSDLVPSQSAKYLGMTIDTGAGKVFPSLARVEKFLTVAERFCSMQSPPAQLWQVILGHLASLERLVPHGRLRMRSLQWHLKTQWSPESDPPSLPVALPEEARQDLSWWMVKDHLLTGVRFGAPAPDLHALSYRVSHTRDWGEVSFAFVTGFVAKTQDPSCLAPRFEGFSVPALPNARKNRNGRLLCPVRVVKVYLDRTASHRPRCERLFVTAGRSKKISKTTVSFWLRKTILRAYELSGTALPVPAPRARETRGIAPSILFRKNFAVDQVLKAGTWRRHTTFTRHYLRDIAHKSLDTFHLGPVVAAQSVV